MGCKFSGFAGEGRWIAYEPLGGLSFLNEPPARKKNWSQWPDLNRRPAVYETAALPTELHWRCWWTLYLPHLTGKEIGGWPQHLTLDYLHE